jgi:hypothetical protein
MPPETDDGVQPFQPQQQQVEPGEPPKKPKRKHTIETAETIPFILLAILFDIISLATFMAPLIAVVGKLIFTCIWLMHGVMPWSKKYWSWYLISFVCEFIPFVSILPMFTIGELKMIAQSRVEDKLQETTGLAQAAIQVAKFKVRQKVKRQIAAGGMSEDELKKKQDLAKSLRFASARTLRRTFVNKAQGRGPKYQEAGAEGEEADTVSPEIQGGRAPLARPSRGGGSGGAGSEAFDGVVAGASMAASAGRSASLPPVKPLPPRDTDDEESENETANAVAANTKGVQDGTQSQTPVTIAEEVETEETVTAPTPTATVGRASASEPDTTMDNDAGNDESEIPAPTVANDVDETPDTSTLAQDGSQNTDIDTEPDTSSQFATNSSPDTVTQQPINDIYREPLPSNDNTSADDSGIADEDADDDQQPPVRRVA